MHGEAVKHNINLTLLPDMKSDYKFQPKLALIRSIADFFSSKHNKYYAFKIKHLTYKFFINQMFHVHAFVQIL